MRSRKFCRHRRPRISWLTLVIAFLLGAHGASAQTSVFTYQGRLSDGGTPANGSYDLQFALWDSASGGSQIGATQNFPAVQVSNGVFTVALDFGANAFSGANRFLEISARQTGVVGFTLLTPRQQITSTPYAVRSANATLADTAMNSTQLGGVAASQYVQNSDSRLTDSRPPAAGSNNYIQNTSNQQAGSNFNISGDGTAGGMLSGNVVNAATQFNFGGSAVLRAPGTDNTFVGLSAGQNNTSGQGNTYVGVGAGTLGTSGFQNTSVGTRAGNANTGIVNSFFGYEAGLNNTTAGGNSFFGTWAGHDNTTGDHNAFFGRSAGFSNTTGTENSYFGYLAGRANVTGGRNAYFGNHAGADGATGGNNSFFGYSAGTTNTGDANSFFGSSAGVSNSTGSNNSFYGFQSGVSNTTASDNAFFGMWAGKTSTTGGGNSFFGRSAGFGNTTGTGNSFFGGSAGLNNTTGFQNNFLGINAGFSNSTGTNNTVIGTGADVGGSNLDNATALGSFARTDCSNCLVLGSIKGINNASGDSKVGIGTTTPASKLDVFGANATCGAARFGWGSFVGFGCFNVLSLTSDDAGVNLIQGNTPTGTVFSVSGNGDIVALGNVGVGTLNPAAKLHVSGGAILLDNNQGFNIRNTGGTPKRVLLADTGNRLHIGSGGGFGFDEIRFDLGTPGTVMTMLSDGNIGIGTTAPDQSLTVNGNASKPGGGSWASFSDVRLKNIRGRYTPGLNAVMRLQPLRYEYKRDNAMGIKSEGEHIGFSAQAVQQIIPEAVTKNDQGYLLVNNDPILWTMLNAIKEQQREIERLQQELKTFHTIGDKTEMRHRKNHESYRRKTNRPGCSLQGRPRR